MSKNYSFLRAKFIFNSHRSLALYVHRRELDPVICPSLCVLDRTAHERKCMFYRNFTKQNPVFRCPLEQ